MFTPSGRRVRVSSSGWVAVVPAAVPSPPVGGNEKTRKNVEPKESRKRKMECGEQQQQQQQQQQQASPVMVSATKVKKMRVEWLRSDGVTVADSRPVRTKKGYRVRRTVGGNVEIKDRKGRVFSFRNPMHPAADTELAV
jgi:hypothetical protein